MHPASPDGNRKWKRPTGLHYFVGISRPRHSQPPAAPPPPGPQHHRRPPSVTAAAAKLRSPNTQSPQYLVETKVAPHATSQEKPRAPKPLHHPPKLDTAEETPLDELTPDYIIHSQTRQDHQHPLTGQVYELTAPSFLIIHRRHNKRYTIQAEGTAATTLYTWATWEDLPHPTLHHAISCPKQEAQTRKSTRPHRRGPAPTQRETQGLHPPGGPHHPAQRRPPHPGVRYHPQPHNHTNHHRLPKPGGVTDRRRVDQRGAGARLNDIQLLKLQGAI